MSRASFFFVIMMVLQAIACKSRSYNAQLAGDENAFVRDCQANPLKCSAFNLMADSGYVTNCAKLWQESGNDVYAFDEYSNVYHKLHPRMTDGKTRLTTVGKFMEESRTAWMRPDGVDSIMASVAGKTGAIINWRDVPIGLRPNFMGGSNYVPIKFYAVRVNNKLLDRMEWVIFRTFVPDPYGRPQQYSDNNFSVATKEVVRQCYPARPHHEGENLPSIVTAIKILNEGEKAEQNARDLDLLYRGMVTFVEAAPVTGEVAALYRGCYLKETSCLRASILVTANVSTYIVLAPAKVSAALGTKGYLVVTAVGAAANAIEGGVQVTQAVEAGRKGHWGVAALHGAGAALRFSAATGLVLEATKAAGSARAVNGQGEVAAKPDAIRSPSTGAVEIADAVSDKTIQEFYEAAASSPVFKRKLDLANLLSGGRRVTVDEILLELQKNSKFIRIENLGGARIDPLANGTFVFQHSTHTGVFSRATAHHELLHLAQFLRDPSLKVSASQMSFLARQAYEPVPALIGSPEIFGAPTLIVSGQVVYLVYESAGLVFKMLSD